MKHTSHAQRVMAQQKRRNAAHWLGLSRKHGTDVFYELYSREKRYYEGFVFALYLAECTNYKSLKAFERELKKPIA